MKGKIVSGMCLDFDPRNGITRADMDAVSQFRDYLEARAEYEAMGMTRPVSVVAACLKVYGTPFGEERIDEVQG